MTMVTINDATELLGVKNVRAIAYTRHGLFAVVRDWRAQSAAAYTVMEIIDANTQEARTDAISYYDAYDVFTELMRAD